MNFRNAARHMFYVAAWGSPPVTNKLVGTASQAISCLPEQLPVLGPSVAYPHCTTMPIRCCCMGHPSDDRQTRSWAAITIVKCIVTWLFTLQKGVAAWG